MNCVYVLQLRISARFVDNPAATSAVNLKRTESLSARDKDVSTLPKGKYVTSCRYDLDNVLDELYDLDNILDKLYDQDNVLDELYDLDNVLDKLYDLLFCFRTQNITEKLRQVLTVRQDEEKDGECEKEKESQPRQRRHLQPSEKRDASAPDDSIDSPVDDSDDDANYQEESSKDDSSEPSDDDMASPDAKKNKTAKKGNAKHE